MADDKKTLEYAKSLVEFSQWGIKNSNVLTRRDRAKRYYRGDHAAKHRSSKLGTYVFNKFAQIARNRTAHIVAKRPRWRFMPTQEGALSAAESLQDLMGTTIWNKIKWSKKGEESINEARDAGTSHIKIIIRNDGFPDAIPLCADEIIIDPKAKKKEHLRYWGHAYSMSIKDIERIYGKKVAPDMELETIKASSVTSNKSYTHKSSNQAPSGVFKNIKFKDGSTWMPDILGKATVYELWVDDKTVETIPYKEEEVAGEIEDLLKGVPIDVHPFENHPRHIKALEKYIAELDPAKDAVIIMEAAKHIEEHAAYPQTTSRKKYPFGRKIMYAGDQVLQNKPNPIAAEMEIGIDFRDLLIKWDYDPTDEYWGKPGVQDLFDPQDILNHRVNSITQGINRLNHGIKKVTKGIGATMRGNLEKLANWVGITVTVSHPNDITIDYGPQMPGQVFDERNWIGFFMDQVMDNTDIMSGQLPKGSPAGVTVNQLLSQGMQPINLIVKHYAEAMEEMARVMMILMIEFVPEDTKLRISDDKEQYKFVDWREIKQDMGYYDIHIDIDAMLETSRQEKLEQALKLAEGGYYDREAVLDRIDDPKKNEIIQRIGERQILQQGLVQAQESAKNWEGQFRNLAQNYNRLSIELDKERLINKDKNGKQK